MNDAEFFKLMDLAGFARPLRPNIKTLRNLVRLVAAFERQECAKIAEARRPVLLQQAWEDHKFGTPEFEQLRSQSREAREIAKAIKARTWGL